MTTGNPFPIIRHYEIMIARVLIIDAIHRADRCEEFTAFHLCASPLASFLISGSTSFMYC